MKIINSALLICLSLSSCSTENQQPKIVSSKEPSPTSHSHKKYNRKEWNHWIDKDKNCFNTRHEILKARSEQPVQYRKKGKECYVQSGLWSDYYFSEKLSLAKEIDIDHIVPLKHAHDIGGSRWNEELKEKFANDPENLVITNKKYNRRKGAKRIDQWLPLNITYACKYYKDWMKIKNKYNLPISEQERNAVDIKNCP